MADQNNELKLDYLLDSALSTYSAVDPRPGLESRILARVQASAQEVPAPWWGVRWLVAASAVAGITVLVLSVLLSRSARKPAPMQVRGPSAPVTQPQPDSNRT